MDNIFVKFLQKIVLHEVNYNIRGLKLQSFFNIFVTITTNFILYLYFDRLLPVSPVFLCSAESVRIYRH